MSAMDAPPGVVLKYLPRPSGAAWAEWLQTNKGTYWESRRIVKMRGILVHTNGAQGEGTTRSAYNVAMSAPSTTKPHYQVDRNGYAEKYLPSNRMGIANYLAAPFFLAIETADPGWGPGKPGDAAGFTPEQAEMVAQIIAWEAEENGFPIEYPTAWNGTGTAAHTEPFGYPYWTNSKGKPCPGSQKKLELRTLIMPRARVIRYGQKPEPPQPEKPPVQPQPSQGDDLVDIFTNAEVFFGNPPGIYKGAVMPNGKPRHIFGPEWIARGAPAGRPLTNAELAGLFAGGEYAE